MALPLLPIVNMHERHRGLTPAIAECYLEAARVCLDRHHIPPQEFTLSDDSSKIQVGVAWEQTDERIMAAWANEIDTTESGAYICALAAAELARGVVAVARAETHTGADYYLAPSNLPIEDLENCLRFEVSGTTLDNAGVNTRLQSKVEQARRGDSDLPALAAVVGFRARLIMMQTVE